MIVQGRVTDWFRVHSSSTAEIVSVSYVEFDEAPDECRCRYLILSRLSNAIYPRSHVGFCSESSLFSHTTCISFVRQIHRKDLEPFLISMIWGRESHPELGVLILYILYSGMQHARRASCKRRGRESCKSSTF
jgi:hypothetical protein